MKKNNLIIVTGPDRTGKTSLINKLNGFIINPRKFTIHSGKPPNIADVNQWSIDHYYFLTEQFGDTPNIADVNQWSIDHYYFLIKQFGSMIKNNYTIMCDRFYEGEVVYGSIFRGQSKNEIYELEKYLPENVKLILMCDTIENRKKREDGLSIENSTDELKLVESAFDEFFDRTTIKHKIKLNLLDYNEQHIMDFLNE